MLSAKDCQGNIGSDSCWFFPKRQILNYSKLKEFADDNFFYENGRQLSKRVENTVGKGEIAH